MSSSQRYWRTVESDAHNFSSCVGKKRHPSRRVALGIRRALLKAATNEDEYRDAEQLEPYRCRCCGSVHLGHSSQRIQEQRELERRDKAIFARIREANDGNSAVSA